MPLKTVAVHEAVILRFVIRRTTRRNRFAHHAVHTLATVERKGQQHFGGLFRVTYRQRREAGEFFPCQQHHKNAVADDHAGRGVVGELRVEGKSEPGEKGNRGLEIGDRQVDENLRSHGFTPCLRIKV